MPLIRDYRAEADVGGYAVVSSLLSLSLSIDIYIYISMHIYVCICSLCVRASVFLCTLCAVSKGACASVTNAVEAG